ncbi:kinase-like domain-containing protein [Favolaschia claudopus]|uniref:Kinase-like domain-containing protein n=1 Tax=Favolaschia claudopus TaxID=2862362 RepID=A0AAW0AIQ3_9AGAR
MATEEVVCDPSLCTNPDSPGECCGDSFEHKTTPGLCGKCYIVLTSSENADKMKDWPQCQGCSAVYKLLKASRCGTCVKKDPQITPSGPVPPLNPQDLNRPPNQSVTDKLQDLQAENRRNAMSARTLHKGSQKTSGAASSVIVGVAKGAPRQITVYLAPGTANTRTDASRILGNATRSFPEDIAMNVCILQDTPVAQGKTKKVYKVICEGMPWVAKRFFEIGAGDEQVEIQQNADFLVQEATRLGKTGYYLGQFIAEAKRRNTSIDDTIAVTEFKLGLEVVADDSAPSPASGISLEAYLAADPSAVQVLWLFEPRRSSAVDHWSGTNEYPPWHQNKLGSTLNAFAHYVYQISQETTVITDVQTSKAVNEQGDGINVLFDMMLHTTNGASGVGDHGQNGINTFVAKHECVRRCVGLRLDQEGFENALKGLEDGDSAAEDDD